MKRILILLICLSIPSMSYAAQRATLQAGTGEEVGTSSNPIKVSVSGNQSAGDATFTGLTVTGTISNSKIGTYGSADATFSTIIATNIANTKIGTYGAADATFQGITAGDVTFGTVRGSDACFSQRADGKMSLCVCGSCA